MAAVATTGEPSDEALVQRVLDGDRDAFAILVDRHKRGIANFIGASVRGPADIADLSQETFLRAYAHLGTFNPALGRYSTWLYHIARNVVRTIEHVVADVSDEADPAGGILRAEADAEVRAALAELPERTRTVLALRYYDNMEYQTIARVMGLSLGNVKTLIHRGKLALAQKLREREAQAVSELAKNKKPSFGRGVDALLFI